MGIAVLYTDTDAVRAVVGAKVLEVPDATFTDQDMEQQLQTALYGWLPTYAAIHTTGSAGGATDDEAYQKDLVVSYCLFFCAVRIVETILTLRYKVGDGKSEVQRFDVDFKELLVVFGDRMEEARGLLEALVNPAGSEGADYFGKASPDYDPVTGV